MPIVMHANHRDDVKAAADAYNALEKTFTDSQEALKKLEAEYALAPDAEKPKLLPALEAARIDAATEKMKLTPQMDKARAAFNVLKGSDGGFDPDYVATEKPRPGTPVVPASIQTPASVKSAEEV